MQHTICEWAKVSREVLMHDDGPPAYWQDADDDEMFVGEGIQDAPFDDAWERRGGSSD